MFLLSWSPHNSLWVVVSMMMMMSILLLFGIGDEGSLSVSKIGNKGPWNSESPHPTTAPDGAFAKFHTSHLKASPDATGRGGLDPIPKHLHRLMKGVLDWDRALLVQDDGAKCPLMDKALNTIAHGYINTQTVTGKSSSRERIFITFLNQKTDGALVRSDMNDFGRRYIEVHIISLLNIFVSSLLFGSVALFCYVVVRLWRVSKSKSQVLTNPVIFERILFHVGMKKTPSSLFSRRLITPIKGTTLMTRRADFKDMVITIRNLSVFFLVTLLIGGAWAVPGVTLYSRMAVVTITSSTTTPTPATGDGNYKLRILSHAHICFYNEMDGLDTIGEDTKWKIWGAYLSCADYSAPTPISGVGGLGLIWFHDAGCFFDGVDALTTVLNEVIKIQRLYVLCSTSNVTPAPPMPTTTTTLVFEEAAISNSNNPEGSASEEKSQVVEQVWNMLPWDIATKVLTLTKLAKENVEWSCSWGWKLGEFLWPTTPKLEDIVQSVQKRLDRLEVSCQGQGQREFGRQMGGQEEGRSTEL